LTERELEERSDVFTHDARAWALAAAGEFTAAQGQLDHALAEGTQDARLFYHAAVIAAKSGRHDDARRWFDRATDFIHMLLPSEQRQLVAIAEDLGDEAADVALAPEGAPSKPTPRN
jgi:tetratricopeptide (TPR) repeat protein